MSMWGRERIAIQGFPLKRGSGFKGADLRDVLSTLHFILGVIVPNCDNSFKKSCYVIPHSVKRNVLAFYQMQCCFRTKQQFAN